MASKYDAINKIYHNATPKVTWTEAARQAGFSGEWTSYKGKAKPRTGDARGQAQRRARFDQPSTELAGYEAKRLKQEVARINAEAEMFGLEPSQIEHLADQKDARAITSGSSGDPTNKARVTQTEARFKDSVKQNVPKGYSVTLNPLTESVRVIPDKFFDPIADPSTLPGVDISIGSNVSTLRNKLTAVRGAIRFVSRKADPIQTGVDIIQQGQTGSLIDQVSQVTHAKVQDPFEASAKARARGGKTTVGTVTLPDLGISEFFMPPKQ